MSTIEIAGKLKELKDTIQLKAAGSNAFPASYWIMVTNEFTVGSVAVVVPTAGNLWVFYEYGSAQAELIEVWHQGGAVTPIALGENNIPVNQGDVLLYQLANPAQDTIKIAYQLT
ncbi:hypothetical protein A4D02_27430 [Niastella koreensis]|uniref:Uncharacterized protein n=2 Tax=Niastella koreensis TaxID=354356 RepID=G8TGX3_NIAKG|nr:hypothetical protein [Niastella koreensis]AEV99575.1 hypothetical protein Niako_3249 [Niastella koreensis GR20-10]OQP50165.1 hypothetical protein A4D02_27430 [Niastella koreensis]